ncbi:hypothetical protein D3C75_1040800 [compost metagenome]
MGNLRQRKNAQPLQQATGDKQRSWAKAVKLLAGQRDGQKRGQRPGQHQAADLCGVHAQLILQIQHGDQADADKQAGNALINHH